jgi:multiple sugar transport system substrate-binding protein
MSINISTLLSRHKRRKIMSRTFYILSIIIALALLLAACAAPTEEAPPPEVPPEETEAPEEPPEPTGEVIFFSTQFSPVEEQEKFRAILQEGGFDVTASDAGPGDRWSSGWSG